MYSFTDVKKVILMHMVMRFKIFKYVKLIFTPQA